MKRIHKSISANEEFSVTSKPISLENNQKYGIKISISAKEGIPHSCYFMVILKNNTGKEKNRFIRWIDDFSGNPKDYEIIFSSDKDTSAILGIRANLKTPVRSNLEFEFDSLNELSISKLDSSIPEKFDNKNNFVVPPLQLTPEQEDALEQRLVWIMSDGRSGTTWLSRQLLKHKDITLWFEPYIGEHLSKFSLRREKGSDYVDKFFSRRENNPEYFFSPQHKNNWLPQLRKLILSRAYSLSQTTDKFIVIKDPTAGNSTKIIAECLPSSKIIFLLRDGRNVVDSKLDMHSEKSWSRNKGRSLESLKPKSSRDYYIRFYSSKWSTNNESIYEGFLKFDKLNRIFVKYEDLKENTFQKLKEIYQFIGINISDDDLEAKTSRYDFKKIPESEKGSGKFFRAAAIDSWKEHFSEDEKTLANSLMEKTLKQFGYTV